MSPTATVKNVLVVEDEGIIAMGLKDRLERSGYGVPGVAATADDAVRMADTHAPDLILMDIRLKGNTDGILAAQEIRRKMDIPVIFLTAHADADTLRRANTAGPFGYIVKPFGTTDIRAHIETALAKHDTERRLRRSTAWFRATLHNVGDGVITVGLDNTVDFMNTAAERLTGWSFADAKGKLIQQVFRIVKETVGAAACGDGGAGFSSVALTVPAGFVGDDSEQAVRRESEMLSRDGSQTIPIETVVSLNQNEDGQLGTVIVFRDITARREMERQARQSRSMETVAVMAGALAHDINNLLTVILGYSSLIQMDEKRSCREAAEIERAAKLGAGLGRELLAVAGDRVIKTEVFELNSVILASAKMLKHVLQPGCEIVLKTSAEPQHIRADKARVQQILLNLTINARSAMPQGGQLTIATREATPGTVELSVQDTGGGMDFITMERVFEPYFTGKATGLGMTIVHTIVAQFGGKIEVESQLGRGTTFHILLPLAAPEPERIEIESGSVSEPMSSRTILIVDDNRDIRTLMSTQFKKASFRTLEAESGEEAMIVLECRGEDIHLLVTDVMMPTMTGPELARKWVARSPQTLVLFISGYSQEALKGNELLNSGRAEFVPKPVTPKELVSKAQSMLALIN